MEAGEILLDRGLLDDEQLQLVRAQGHDAAGLLEAAVDQGFLQAREALEAWGEEVGLDFVDLAEIEVDLSLLDTFPGQADSSPVTVPDSSTRRRTHRCYQRPVRSLYDR